MLGMLGVTSLMQALEIRAQNFNNLPVSNVMAYGLCFYLSPVERRRETPPGTLANRLSESRR